MYGHDRTGPNRYGGPRFWSKIYSDRMLVRKSVPEVCTFRVGPYFFEKGLFGPDQMLRRRSVTKKDRPRLKVYLFGFGLGLGLVLILEFLFGSWKNGQNGRLRTKTWVSLDNKEVKYISFKLYWFIRENRDDDRTITVKKRRLVAKKNL